MTDDRDVAALLRDGLNAGVRGVTATSQLTEQFIAAAVTAEAPRPRLHRVQPWLLPAVAAAVVALLISSAVVGTKLLHSSRPTTPATQPVAPTPPVPTPTPTPAPTKSGSSTPSTSSVPTSSAPAGPVIPPGGAVPPGFRAVDLTWTSANTGWALGTAPCSTAPCTSIVRTVDGGKNWVGLPAPKAELTEGGCTSSCITNLRFATPFIGYAFGPKLLYLTTDGGESWRQQAGGADALEIENGTVLRLTSAKANCPIDAGCDFVLQHAEVGTTDWQDAALPAVSAGKSYRLIRSAHQVVLGIFGNQAGGAESARTSLLISTDDGASWRLRADPCPTQPSSANSSGEMDTRQLTAAAGTIFALCAQRSNVNIQLVSTSTDGGVTFASSSAGLPATAQGQFTAASATVVFFQSADRLYRSTDAGRHWSAVTGPAQVGFLGFETPTVGRAIGSYPSGSGTGSAIIWTTGDAGASWSSYTFP